METFLYQHNLTNIVKEGTCFKNSSKPSIFDLFLTNNSSYFQNTKIFFTSLSDFHKLVTTTLKISIPKNKPLQINYRNYKRFNNDSFNEDLKLAFNNTDNQICKEFGEIFMHLIDHHGSYKQTVLRQFFYLRLFQSIKRIPANPKIFTHTPKHSHDPLSY